MLVHGVPSGGDRSPAQNRSDKQCRVREGRAHVTLVYDGARAVGWWQFGAPDELPTITSRRACESGLGTLHDWRITCLYVGKGTVDGGWPTRRWRAPSRRSPLGGGTVESYPEDTAVRAVSASFLHNERHGFRPDRRVGKYRWVVTRTVAPDRP